MQKLGSIAVIISCVLLTLEFGSSAEADTETNTRTPGLWSAFGCVVTEDNITLCRQRERTEKKKADKSEEDSEEGSGFFESITDFMMDGLVQLFESEQPSDKNKEEDDEIEVENEPEESKEPGLFDDDAYDKGDKKGENNNEDYDNNDGYKDEKDVDDEKNDDVKYDEKDEYNDDDWEEYHNDASNVVDASNSTSVKIRRKRDDSSGNQQGGIDEGRKDKKKNKDDGLMKLMMMGMFLQSKMSTMMMMFDGVMRLKSFAMSMMNFMLRIIQLYMDNTKQNKSEPHKVIYYEQAHHDHIYDQTSHEDNGGWSKSLKHGKDGQEPQNLVYSAYVPNS